VPRKSPLLTALCWMAVLSCSASVRATAQEDCAITLHVTEGSSGRPITSTWIELEDSSGTLVRKEMMRGATLNICDFGFGPHVLRVGTNGCLPVTVSNIRLVLGSPLSLHVVLDSCGYQEAMRNACLVYFRVMDDHGKPIPTAIFSPSLTNQTPRMDSYGRYQTLFKGSHDLTFTAPGFESTTVHTQCRQTEEVDQVVIMANAR
jgi:hypothetical protein